MYRSYRTNTRKQVAVTRIFVSTWGQNDNIGDSILRRGLLRSFQSIDGVELHVHVGRREAAEPNDEGYLTAIGLRGDEVLYDRAPGWFLAAAASAFVRRTVVVLPAGEIDYSNFGQRLLGVINVIATLTSRLRGGTAVQVGAGVRMSTVGTGSRRVHDSVAIPLFERLSRRAMAMVAWRDSATRDAFGIGDVVPDWAFGEGPDPLVDGLGPVPAQRKYIAVTTRWDRDVLSEDKVALLRGLAERHGLTLQVYSQVRRDYEHTKRLADALHPGTGPILFQDQTHAEWEQQVRALHRESAVVASDRAHALIIGVTEGAIPLPISNFTTEKVVRTLRTAGFAPPADDESDVEGYLTSQLADRSSIERRIVVAREELTAARNRLRAVAAGRQTREARDGAPGAANSPQVSRTG